MAGTRGSSARRRVVASVATLSLTVAGCAGSTRQPATPTSPEPAAALVVSVDAAAGRAARRACTAHSLRAAVDHWRVSRDSVAAFDARVVRHVDSLFALLRSDQRFRHLSSAAQYHRQYLGIWFDGRPLVYVHAVQRTMLQRVGPAARDLHADRSLISLCDGGTGVFGLLLDPQTGTIGRLEFGHGLAGPYSYDDLVPPKA